jgi:hypothetical protein
LFLIELMAHTLADALGKTTDKLAGWMCITNLGELVVPEVVKMLQGMQAAAEIGEALRGARRAARRSSAVARRGRPGAR